MSTAWKYKLVVSTYTDDQGVVFFRPFQNQEIPGLDIPQLISANDVAVDQSISKYLIWVNDDASQAVGILEAYEDPIWVLDIIDLCNKFNRTSATDLGIDSKVSIPMPENLFMEQKTWEFLVTTVELGLYPLITGPTGCGKTVAARGLASALGFDYYAINCGALFKPKSSLVGTVQAQGGSTFLFESEFLQYFKSDRPTIIYLDEISRIPAAAGNMLFPVLDREQNYLYVEEKSERIYKGANVTFVAAANFGVSYVDARRLDEAFLNRFIPIHLNYLTQDQEVDLIKFHVPRANKTDIIKIVRTANLLRAAKDSLGQEVSHRHTIDATKYLTRGFSVIDVLDNVIGNLFVNGSDDRREAADKIIKSSV